MKISRQWLQTYFDKQLPEAQELADALMFHAFEVESVEGDVLDVKVTPNRGHDCLSHRGIAKELSAILKIPIKSDPLRAGASLKPRCSDISLYIEDSKLCARYIAGYIRGVKVGKSPEWLKRSLESIGQKSINNIVDAANYVMFNIGQPLHAFDAGQLSRKDRKYAIKVRLAKKGEMMLALDDQEYILTDSTLTIVDGNSDAVIGIAGVKGGKPAGVTESTRDIIIESANFDGASIRKTAAALKLRTDASDRFQQVLSPELAAYGMCAAVDLIHKLAGGELVGFADEYPSTQTQWSVSVSISKVNSILGMTLSDNDIADVFTQLGLPFERKYSEFVISIPFERLDLTPPAGGPEDLIEEVARIIGYDKIPATELPSLDSARGKPEINANFYAAEKAREELMVKGYSEVYTSVFAEEGERAVANKIGGEKPYLRTTLVDNLSEAYERNVRNKDLLGLKEVKLFEIGTVWKDGKEVVMLGSADSAGVREEPLRGIEAARYDNLPTSTAERYEPFSKYPSIVRDISLWVPRGTNSDEVGRFISNVAGTLVRRCDFFDEFKKENQVSYAFRLVFQSSETTLTDAKVNTIMEQVYSAVMEKGWEVR